MYLIYIDESGSANINHSSEYYILSAIIIHEYSWRKIEGQIKSFKLKYFPDCNPHEFELHMSNIVHKKGIFRKKTADENIIFIKEFFQLISRFNCTIIAVAIEKKKIGSTKKIEYIAWRFLLERFGKYLERRNKRKKKIDLGLMIIDRIGKKTDYTRMKLMRDVRNQLNNIVENQLDFLIEDPVFVDSQYKPIIQSADAIAFCINRIFQKENRKTLVFKECFEIIKNKFDKNPKGKIEGAGFKVFPTEKEFRKYISKKN